MVFSNGTLSSPAVPGGSDPGVPLLLQITSRTRRLIAIAGLCLALLNVALAADKEKVVWKPVPDAILQVDSRAPKVWNVFQAGKKFDPLLLQLGYALPRNLRAQWKFMKFKPEQLQHKGDDLLWRETDKPDKPSRPPTGAPRISARRGAFGKTTAEGRLLDIQIPQMPDFRRGIY